MTARGVTNSKLFLRHAPFLGPIPDLMVLVHVHPSPILCRPFYAVTADGAFCTGVWTPA